MNQVNLMKSAVALMNGAEKVRVRFKNGTLELRPTARKSGVKLPKGEMLVDIKRKGFFNQILVNEPMLVGDFGIAPVKHGWLRVVELADGATAAVKIPQH